MDKKDIIIPLVCLIVFLGILSVIMLSGVVIYKISISKKFINNNYNITNIPNILPDKEDIAFMDDPKINNKILKVYGTIYEKSENMTIYGFCFDEYLQPLISNASIVIKNSANNIKYSGNMTNVSTGEFILNITSLNETGIFSLNFKCDYDGGYGYATNEIQVAKWISDIKNSLTDITNGTERNLTIYPFFPNYVRFNNLWKLTAVVYNQDNILMDDNDIACNLTSDNFGTKSMYYYNGYFRFNGYPNSSNINFTISCDYK